MIARDRRLLHWTTAAVGGTGAVYGVMRYLLQSDDPYAIVNHPWQPHVQHLHVLSAPLLVFAIGVIWKDHAARYLLGDQMRRRRTGLAMVLTAAPMVLSGYGLQVAVEPAWRQAWIVAHVATSLLWLGGYLAHRLTPRGGPPAA